MVAHTRKSSGRMQRYDGDKRKAWDERDEMDKAKVFASENGRRVGLGMERERVKG